MIRTSWTELVSLHRNDDVPNRLVPVLGPVVAEGSFADMIRRWLDAPAKEQWRYAITFSNGERVHDTTAATVFYNDPSFPR